MNTPMLLIPRALFCCMVFLYWFLAFRLIDQILEQPKLAKAPRLLVQFGNMVIVIGAVHLSDRFVLPMVIMLALMLLEFWLLYRDSVVKALFCAMACMIHVLTIRTAVVGLFSLLSGLPAFEIFLSESFLLLTELVSFGLLNLAILCTMRFLPLDSVRTITNHPDHQWFMIAWMFVNNIYLLIYMTAFQQQTVSLNSLVFQLTTPISILAGLYIVLFFSFRSSQLLGYKEKAVELQQTVALAQQYRDSVTKDAIMFYEINLSKDLIVSGLEELRQKNGGAPLHYTDLLGSMPQKMIDPEDVPIFTRYASITNLTEEFERGKSETSTEYRRLMPDGEYLWVRAVTNLGKNVETGDLLAYVCIKNIDVEKRRQLELQQKAERDPLTGLYNKEVTAQLINAHLSLLKSSPGGVGGKGAAMFMLDVDCFKEINDHLGHVYGDAVLCELADKLRGLFRKDDIVGRIGGDEFIAYAKNLPSPERLKEKAEEICKAFRLVYQGALQEKYSISCSVGVALFPRDGHRFEQLYQYADSALYQAKRLGKNTYSFDGGEHFTEEIKQRTEIESFGPIQQKSFRSNRIEYVFKILYQSENSVAAIHSVLELVASHFSFERGYIFETSKDGRNTSNTFEWCAEGVTPEIDNLQEVPIEAVSTANANFHDHGTFILKSLDDLQPIEREVLQPQGIKSMFQFGIFDKSHLLGFIGFDNCRNESVPDEVEIDEITTICNILSTFFVKQYIDQVSEDELTLFQSIMNHLENYIYVINIQTFEVLFMNEKTRALMQATGSAEPCYRFFRGNDCQCEDCPVLRLSPDASQKCSMESFNEKLGIWIETTATPLRWRDGSVTALINCADITRQKQEHLLHIDQLEKLAYVDELTGGRTYHKFKQDAQRILEQQADLAHLIVKLDIDNFKLINQMYGHETGDEVLRAVSDSLKHTTRDNSEIYARVANDEFIALFTLRCSSDETTLYENFLQRFHKLLGQHHAFKFNFPHGRYTVHPGDIQGIDITDIFEKVNIAHKLAKQDRMKGYVVYEESITQDALNKKEIENHMESALENDEFEVYLQPKYHLADAAIGGAEALVRWSGGQNPNLFYPDAFIPAFEKNGFIIKLDLYMLRKVCGIIRGWLNSGIDPIVVSVNFSRLHLNNPHFVADLCKIVDADAVPHHYIEIEITETVIYDNIGTLEVLLEQLHTAGFTMSMDDFGSGYSSLGMLKNLPVDVIKMDRSFFVNPKDADRSKVVVGSVIAMAESLGIHIVAEGVETQDQIDLLRDLHCNMAQGYFFAKPMPADAFRRLLEARSQMQHS